MDLKEKIRNFPMLPGVYLMRNKAGKIIYVGKAIILKNRVRSYFTGKYDSPKTRALVKHIADIDIITTDSEVEALVLEQNMIKEHQPRYNVNLKDDKKFPYIKITADRFPRLEVTRYKRKDKAKYFGPYTNVKEMRKTAETLRRIFPTRTCKKMLPGSKTERPCLNFQIHRCPGVCNGKVTEEEYDGTVKKIKMFLSGNPKELAGILTHEMKVASDHMEYERAGALRDQLREFEAVLVRQKVMDMEEVDRDVFALARMDDAVCGLVLQMRSGKLIGSRHFYLTGCSGLSDKEAVTSFLKQYYVDTDHIPREVFLPEDLAEKEMVLEWLKRIREGSVTLFVPRKGEKHKLLELAKRNAELLLRELLIQKEKARGKIPYSVERLQEDLHLDRPPRIIEAFDISNISGKDAVGSMVVFKDGRPYKGAYRRFKIKTVDGPDDFAMMQEVIRRRYTRVKQEKQQIPDLILVDGGKGQLSSTMEELVRLGMDTIPVIGLAKKLEEVFLPGLSEPQNIAKHSSGLKMLQQIRDEAHRFAITYHKKLREKRTIQSELDKIPGIGKKMRTALLKKLGSVKRVKEASVGQLREVEGVGQKQAEKIIEWFRERDENENRPELSGKGDGMLNKTVFKTSDRVYCL